MKLTALTLVFTTVLAHGGINWYLIDGIEYRGSPRSWRIPSIQRQWDGTPIFAKDVLKDDIACGYNSTMVNPSLHAPIRAGQQITAYHDTKWDDGPAGGWYHTDGPIYIYLGRCPGLSCEGFDATKASWFKVAQIGLRPGAPNLYRESWLQTWAIHGTDVDGGADAYPDKQPGLTLTIPEEIEPGAYLIRHEVINLASYEAELFVQCAQLNITSSSKGYRPTKEFMTTFPGAYHPHDQGLAIADDFFDSDPPPPQLNTTEYHHVGPKRWYMSDNTIELPPA